MVYGRGVTLLCMLALFAGCGTASQDQERDALAGSEAVRDWLNGAKPANASQLPDMKPRVAPVEDMIAGLVDKLEQNPNDRKGWELLARSYVFVGDLEQAQAATERAIALGADAGELTIVAEESRPRPN